MALQATDMSVQVHGFRESSVAGIQGSSREVPWEVKPWGDETIVKSMTSHIMMVLPVI